MQSNDRSYTCNYGAKCSMHSFTAQRCRCGEHVKQNLVACTHFAKPRYHGCFCGRHDTKRKLLGREELRGVALVYRF